MVMLKETGILLSCSFDHKVIFWNYPQEQIVKTIEKENLEFTCMDYIAGTKMLVLGDNQKHIFTFQIDQYLDPKIQIGKSSSTLLSQEETKEEEFKENVQIRKLTPEEQEEEMRLREAEMEFDEKEEEEKKEKEVDENKTEFLDEREKEDDEILKKVLQGWEQGEGEEIEEDSLEIE
jgi:hypothetical protein